MTMLNLAQALMPRRKKKNTLKRKEFETKLIKVYNEAIANGSTVEKKAILKHYVNSKEVTHNLQHTNRSRRKPRRKSI